MGISASEAAERFPNSPDRFLDVGAGEVAHRSFGTGPDVLFVHGWPVSGATFRKLLPHLTDKFTCHVIDLPGAGSSRFADATPVTVDQQIITVRRVIDEFGFGQRRPRRTRQWRADRQARHRRRPPHAGVGADRYRTTCWVELAIQALPRRTAHTWCRRRLLLDRRSSAPSAQSIRARWRVRRLAPCSTESSMSSSSNLCTPRDHTSMPRSDSCEASTRVTCANSPPFTDRSRYRSNSSGASRIRSFLSTAPDRWSARSRTPGCTSSRGPACSPTRNAPAEVAPAPCSRS